MKKSFKIKKVNFSNEGDSEEVATGFFLEGLGGDVDPLVCGEFCGEPYFESQNELNDWYKSQVGKTLFCDELVVMAVSTVGKTYIV